MLLVDLQLSGYWTTGHDVPAVWPVYQEVWLFDRVEEMLLQAKLAKVADRGVSGAAHGILWIKFKVEVVDHLALLFLSRVSDEEPDAHGLHESLGHPVDVAEVVYHFGLLAVGPSFHFELRSVLIQTHELFGHGFLHR